MDLDPLIHDCLLDLELLRSIRWVRNPFWRAEHFRDLVDGEEDWESDVLLYLVLILRVDGYAMALA